MSGCELAKRPLERVALQTSNVDTVEIFLTLKVLVLSRSHEGPESLERYVSVQGGYRVDELV